MRVSSSIRRREVSNPLPVEKTALLNGKDDHASL
jgi:hypothetical protein